MESLFTVVKSSFGESIVNRVEQYWRVRCQSCRAVLESPFTVVYSSIGECIVNRVESIYHRVEQY